jgi:hypothetical protein
MLKSARMFTRMGEGIVAVPSFGASTGATPTVTTASSGIDLTSLPSATDLGSMSNTANGTAQQGEKDGVDDMFAGISFEELLGGYGGADILAS